MADRHLLAHVGVTRAAETLHVVEDQGGKA